MVERGQCGLRQAVEQLSEAGADVTSEEMRRAARPMTGERSASTTMTATATWSLAPLAEKVHNALTRAGI